MRGRREDLRDFKSWLQKGLGRPAIVIKASSGRQWREPLLEACRRDLTYDRQCEESRGPYLQRLIELSGEAEFCRNQIIACLLSDDDILDLYQLFEIAAGFANEHPAARQAMYSAFARHGFSESGAGCAEQLVALDGLRGLTAVMLRFTQIEVEDRPWQFGRLIRALNKHHGAQPLSAEWRPYLEEWQESERPRERQLGRVRQPGNSR